MGGVEVGQRVGEGQKLAGVGGGDVERDVEVVVVAGDFVEGGNVGEAVNLYVGAVRVQELLGVFGFRCSGSGRA